ncbi:MAG: Ig-like domain-containing protein [Clostridia bacterium]|nr:Ig-like domain-containing protein [Clostridia bacterium]
MSKFTKRFLGVMLSVVLMVSILAVGFSASAIEEWSAAKASNGGYQMGDQVTYNGSTYECIVWWVGANSIPGSDTTSWKLISGGSGNEGGNQGGEGGNQGGQTGNDPGAPVLTSVTVNVLQTRDPEEYMGWGYSSRAATETDVSLRNFSACKAINLVPGDDIVVYTHIRSGSWYLGSYDDCARIKVDSHGCITVSGASFGWSGVTDKSTCNYLATPSYGGITLKYQSNSGTQTIYTSQYLSQPTDGGVYGAGVDEATLEDWATLNVNLALTAEGGDRQAFSVNYVQDLIAGLGAPARTIARNSEFEAYVQDLTAWYAQCKAENDDYMTHYNYQYSDYYLHDVYCQGVWDTMPAHYGWAQDENTVPGRMIASQYNLNGYSYGLAGGGQNPWVLCDYLERNAGVAGTAGEGWQYGYDEVAETPYLWNAQYGIFLTYENAQSLQARCDYINSKNLAGCIIWEISGDQTATYEMTAIMRDELKNNGKQVIAYFTNWAVYNKFHQYQDPTILPWDKLTVINYGFFQVGGYSEGYPDRQGSVLYPANTLQSMDRWADDYTVVSTSDAANAPNMLLSMADMAAQYPDVKIMASVGGWTRGDGFNSMVQTAATRSTFINSVIQFMNKYTYFDGIDFDWEYPTVDRLPDFDDPNDMGSPTVEGNFSKYADLMEEMRTALNSTFGSSGRNMITTCAPADPDKLSTDPTSMVRLANACTYLNVMTYDYHGAFDPIIGYNSPLYTPAGMTEAVDGARAWSTDSTVAAYNAIGIANSKLNIGTPYYSRGWAGVKTDANGAPMGLQDPTPLDIEVTNSLVITTPDSTIGVGDTLDVAYTVAPAGTTVTWTSSDTAVATVDANGVVTGVAAGTAVITATGSNGLTDTLNVTVEAAAQPDIQAYIFKVGSQNAYWATYDYPFTVEVPCQYVGGFTYVPFRTIATAAGAKSVFYNSNTAEITIENAYGMTFVLSIGSTDMRYTTDGVTYYDGTINAAPTFIDGQVCLPTRDTASITFASVAYVSTSNDGSGYVIVSETAFDEAGNEAAIAAYDAKFAA